MKDSNAEFDDPGTPGKIIGGRLDRAAEAHTDRISRRIEEERER